MARKMTLGKKIGWGFAGLMVITVFLGGLAMYQMSTVASAVNTLAQEYVPEASVGSSIERSALETMYAVRAYIYSSDQSFLDAGRKKLEEARKSLGEAQKLANGSKNLGQLKVASAKALEDVNQYEGYLNEYVGYTDSYQTSLKNMGSLAGQYSKIADDFLERAAREFDLESKKGAEGDSKLLRASVQKYQLMSHISTSAGDARIAVWKAVSNKDPKAILESMQLFENIDKIFGELKETITAPEDRKQADDVRGLIEKYQEESTAIANDFLKMQENNKKRGASATSVLEQAKATAIGAMEETTNVAGQSEKSLDFASSIMIGGLLVAVLIGSACAWLITRGISKAMNEIINGLASASEQISAAAAQQSRGGQLLAQGASEQASSLEETSASLEELSSMTTQNAQNTRAAKDKAGKTREVATQGREAMDRLSTAIDKIKESANQTATIIKAIDEIAFQTNLLALNAAVEAARAGDSGKGFAVVADEVRNLAQRSAEAAKNTGQLIQVSQTNAEHGVSVTDEVARVLDTIAQEAENVAQLITEVASASEEQTTGLGQINTAVTEMDKVTQSTAANAQESAAASEELAAQARELNDVVAVLREMITGNRNDSSKTETAKKHPVHHLDWDSPAPEQAAHETPRKRVSISSKHSTNGNGRPAPRKAQETPAQPEDIFPL